MERVIFVTGGARSGKSDFAQQLAHAQGGDRVLFVATAEAYDEDMARRIAAHQASRPPAWGTLESPRQVARNLQNASLDGVEVVLMDCVTLLVSNLILQHSETEIAAMEQTVHTEIDELLRYVDASGKTFIVVTNEVGLGMVPSTALGRVYRDLLGRANQQLMRRADRAYFMVSGLPIDLRAVAVSHTTAIVGGPFNDSAAAT